MGAWVQSPETPKIQCGGSQLQLQHMELEAEGFFFFFFFRILRHCSQVSEAVLELTEQTSCLSILDVGATSVSHHIQRWGLPISTVGKKQLGYGKGSLGRTTQTVQLYISSFIFSLGKGRCRLVWSGMSTHSVNTF